MPPAPRRSRAEIEQAERETELRSAFYAALLLDMKNSDDPSARRAACKLFADDVTQKYDALREEIETLRQAVGDKSAIDEAVAAKNVAEAALETIKGEWSATVGAEVKKVKDELEDERRKLAQRDLTLKRAETALRDSADVSKIKQAFEYLSGFIRKIESWRPASFFSPEVPNVFFVKKIWFPTCEPWVGWENELIKLPREQQSAIIASEIHAHGCMTCQYRSKYDLSPERRQYLNERAKFMGIEDQVYTINREKTEVCRLQPHPMPASIDYDYGARRNAQLKTLVEGLPEYL